MSQPSCDRAALAEAMFDGRLGPSERSSTERHLKSCSSCQALFDELGSLQTLLRSSASDAVAPLEHQRARLALLREGAGPAISKRRRPTVLRVAALLALPLGVFAATSSYSPVRLWHTTAETVKKPTIPKPIRTLTATRPLPSALPTPSSMATATSSPASAPSSPRQKSDARLEKAAPNDSPVAAASRASLDFADAMQTLARSDFGASASKLHAFTAAHPRDPRVEDATYLEAIALERAGRLGDATTTARRYLALYPNGAHRTQAQRIAGD